MNCANCNAPDITPVPNGTGETLCAQCAQAALNHGHYNERVESNNPRYITRTIARTNGEWHGLNHGRPEPLDALEMLTVTYHAWLFARGLPLMSADELLIANTHGNADMTPAERAWLVAFSALWDATT